MRITWDDTRKDSHPESTVAVVYRHDGHGGVVRCKLHWDKPFSEDEGYGFYEEQDSVCDWRDIKELLADEMCFSTLLDAANYVATLRH